MLIKKNSSILWGIRQIRLNKGLYGIGLTETVLLVLRLSSFDELLKNLMFN